MQPEEKELVAIWYKLTILSKDIDSKILAIVPPQWNNNENWSSPWQIFNNGGGSPATAKYLDLWQKMATYYSTNNIDNWHKTAIETQQYSTQISKKYINPNILKLEVLYNKLQLFKVSLALYIFTLICLMFSPILWRKIFTKTAKISIISGVIFHFIGLLMRIIIMHRPPVTTLYESIIFVGLIGVIFALIIEHKKQDKTGLIIGAILGSSLQFIGMRYSADGDTLGMLSAVLNTNFWLATHVVTITIGYGCCLVAGVLGHIYLVQKAIGYTTTRLNDIMKNMLAVSLVALFFAVLGTILGGIWADQSWGRFWGWDPKENGAMFICLWLIWIIHGRISGLIKPFGFAISMILTNVAVALAWFGVNLLGVGLHSYGFTSGIAMNLAIFCISEILFIIIISSYILYKNKQATVK